MGFGNPVMGGAVLLRNAMQSVDYVAGVSGWQITRLGAAELNNAVIRGSISAGNGTVLLNGGGISVAGITTHYDVNFNGGFLARAEPDDGRLYQMTPNQLAYRPTNPTVNGNALTTGQMFVGNLLPSPVIDQPYVSIISPFITGRAFSRINLYGERSDGVSARVEFPSAVLPFVDDFNHNYLRGENGATLVSFAGLTQTTFTVSFVHAFANQPRVSCNIDSGAGPTARWQARAINVSTTQFTFFLFNSDGTSVATWSNVQVSWKAEEPT